MGLFDSYNRRKQDQEAAQAGQTEATPPQPGSLFSSAGAPTQNLGAADTTTQPYAASETHQQPYSSAGAPTQQLSEEQALARYRYMLRTAPPEAIEQAHAEAFAKMTPEQRAYVQQELAKEQPIWERIGGQKHDDPASLARVATRTEMRKPGTMERLFGRRGHGMGGHGMGMGGMGMGGMIAGSILGALAFGFIGSMIADQLLEGFEEPMGMAEEAMGMAEDPMGAAEDAMGDFGGEDFGGGDFGGGDFGEF